MNDAQPKTDGWFYSLRRMSESMVGLAQSRIKLFAIELQEEKIHALNLVVWLVVALALGVAGFLVGLGALAIYLWDIAGYFGLVGLALAALVAAAGVLWGICRRIRSGPAPFAETIAEFRKDRACLRQTH